MYELKTDADFFYAIAAEKEVAYLSPDLIGGGQISRFDTVAVMIGDEYLFRNQFQFFIREE